MINKQMNKKHFVQYKYNIRNNLIKYKLNKTNSQLSQLINNIMRFKMFLIWQFSTRKIYLCRDFFNLKFVFMTLRLIN